MAIFSRDEFRARAHHDGEGRELYRELRGQDFEIEPWEWLAEASPFANDEPGAQVVKWARAVVAYNAWASGVGRPAANIEDLVRAGAAELMEQIFRTLVSWPAWRVADADYGAWSTDDLYEHLSTLRAQALAAGWLGQQGVIDEGDAIRIEAVGHLEVAMSAELERRNLRS